VQRFYEKLSDCLASGTVHRIHTTLHGALKAAQQAHLIASNPTEQIIAPRFSYGAKQILTDEQLDVFMKVIAEDEIWHDFFYTELTTGLRRGEICGLKWEDFDETYGTLKICRTVYQEAGGGLTARDTKTSAGTQKIVLPSSTAALEKAVTEKLIVRNPAEECKLPPARRMEMRLLSREELQKLLIQARAEGYYEVFLLELTTGLRVGELMALQWDDLNFNTGELRIERQVCQIKGELLIQPPKNKASIRTVILPTAVVTALKKYRQTVFSRWMFPSPKKEEAPIAPSVASHRLAKILKHAGCKKVRFHDLRHVFATNALEHGMDVKTLSTVIGHTSSATTLNIYAHVTSDMQRQAAVKIDQGIGKAKAIESAPAAKSMPTMTDFQPTKKRRRRWGTGSLCQNKSGRWTGRCAITWPDGRLETRSVHADTEEECERLLAIMIAEMRAEVVAEKERLSAEDKAS